MQNTKYNEIRTIAFLLTFCFLVTPLWAQDNADVASNTNGVEEDAPGTYLDRHNAIKNTKKMQEQTIHDIHTMRILMANFGDKVEGASKDYEDLKNTYKRAQVEWYQRHFINASKLHQDCRKMSLALFKKFADYYDQQVSGLLKECSEAMVNMEFSNSIEPGKEQDSKVLVQQSSYKLNTAFQQHQQGAEAREQNRYAASLNHYRLAKLFSIEVLKNLELDPQKRKALDEKYNTDVMDARGYTANSTTQNKK